MSKDTQFIEKMLRDSEDIDSFLAQWSDDCVVTPYYKYAKSQIEKRNLSLSEVIKKANLTKSSAYKILKGERLPSRDKMIQLAIGIGMSVDETNYFLKLGEKSSLYVKNKRDAVILYALNHKMPLIDIEILLEKEGCDIFVDD